MRISYTKKLLFYFSLITLFIFPIDANAWLFFGSEKKNQLNEANKTYDLAIKANEEGNTSDALQFLSDAHGKYSSILNSYPEYETEHIIERINTCSQKIKIIKDKIVSGEISLESINPPENNQEKITFPSDDLEAKEETHTQDSKIAAKIDTTIEEPVNEQIQNSTQNNNFTYSSTNPLANVEESTRIKLINSMLDSKKITDVIFYLDEIIEVEKDSTPLSLRCLYVEALISIGNKAMATTQLNILKKAAPQDPSVRSLAAALAIANGNTMEAMLQLDKLIAENPTYAEARINYAYLLLLMDPNTYRNAAIDSYKRAIKLGAKRDFNLEKNLNIVIK